MEKSSGVGVNEAGSERLRGLAQRCRELAELTAIPDVTRELLSIARALEDEAGLETEA